MAEWFVRDMKGIVHDPKVIFSNPGQVRLGVCSTSVYVALEPKVFICELDIQNLFIYLHVVHSFPGHQTRLSSQSVILSIKYYEVRRTKSSLNSSAGGHRDSC